MIGHHVIELLIRPFNKILIVIKNRLFKTGGDFDRHYDDEIYLNRSAKKSFIAAQLAESAVAL